MLAAQGVLVGLRDAWGRALTGHAAADRLYVAGQEGQRYSLWIRNETSQRFEVVASVDGLDVINGRSASLDNRGYLLEPGGELVIDGFRLSDQEVAAFRFGRVSDSYAARTGSDRQVGLIGLAFFAERDPVWTPEEIRRRETADPFPADQRYAFPPPQ